MSPIPTTMRGLAVMKYCGPSGYEVMELPVPTIKRPNQVLIRVHASAIMTGDCQRAKGIPILQVKPTWPMKFGAEGAGVVIAIGSEVTSLKIGDEVYGLVITRPMFTDPDEGGMCAEYAVAEARMLLRKPPHISFEEAAAMGGFTVTANQSLKRALSLMGVENLDGKTVYVPGALSGLGFVSIQIAKNVLGAKKIISTVSTTKMPLVEQYLPGLVDQLIDYQTQNLLDVVPKGSVDVVVNTQWSSMSPSIPLLDPKNGCLVSMAAVPPASLARLIMGPENVPFWLAWIFDAAQYWYAFKLRGTNIKFEMISGDPEIKEDRERAGELIATGKVKAVMRVVNLSDIKAIREECLKVSSGKGGLGRLVIRIVE